MRRHMTFVFCTGLVLSVWMPSLNVCPGGACRALLVGCLLLLLGMFVEAFYGVSRKFRPRRTSKRQQVPAQAARWPNGGKNRFSGSNKVWYTPDEGLFFVDD